MNALAFRYDETIDLEVPLTDAPIETHQVENDALRYKLEKLAGIIPERIKDLEKQYEQAYARVLESEGEAFFTAMDEVALISRKIGELNIWYYRLQGRHLVPYYG
ncbi:MAG: hypothetical protein IMX04_04210 [Candidatus Carbobacillus altaicus]|uniref:Uncharacterized protein n=1 Tax=Candidatus Carbonibacillus altaicus TaxID=2163959 RepID=A0A2R6Y3F3_9BACL|nr:hypothetical protein [Candidatus Carbobacillus altaicus]PTQ57193.1 MAG: hypothetical protein BSOLF_2063 [Candidatus Carbobacillus altaicus]